MGSEEVGDAQTDGGSELDTDVEGQGVEVVRLKKNAMGIRTQFDDLCRHSRHLSKPHCTASTEEELKALYESAAFKDNPALKKAVVNYR